MPVKRRTQKYRFGQFTELELWDGVFSIGFDALSLLALSGIETEDLIPPRDLTLEAWRRLGPQFLATRDSTRPEPWALNEFGDPANAR
jgi:hypothetical protein